MKTKLISILVVATMIFALASCNKYKDNNEQKSTEIFTELKVDPNFDFDSFKNLSTNIVVPLTRQTSTTIVQIFNGNPAEGGRLITTGSLNDNNEYNGELRLPADIKEVYIGKISSDGLNEYVPVQVDGNKIVFDFGKKNQVTVKSVAGNTCNDGSCTNVISGTNNNLEIKSGEYYCVDEGTTATFNKLKIKSGGTLRICGTATVNSYKSDGGNGKLIVTPSGTMTLPKYNNKWDIDNYGNLNWSGNGSTKTYGEVRNWGTITVTTKYTNEGDFINHGYVTFTKDFKNNPGGVFVNHCSMYVTEDGNNAFIQNGKFTNNGLVDVEGTSNLTGDGGGKGTWFGLNSLFETEKFSIEGYLKGPSGQGSQIHALGSNSNGKKSKVTGGATVLGFVDLWAGVLTVSNNATIGSDVTFHDPGYTIPTPNCNLSTPPVITSSLQIGGVVGDPITTYIITATGSNPITYSASNLPPGLSYDANTHTISGTPTQAGTYNVPLEADNFMGTDNKTLVITITQPAAPPVITSVLTSNTTVNQPYTYTMTASGTGSITYSATNLPDGLSFDPSTQKITGTPTTGGTYNITLTATNAGGSDTKTLVLTVGTPPTITSPLTATGSTFVQFPTYTVTGTGDPTISYNATNLPPGLTFNSENNTINGTPTAAGVTNVTLTATNSYGNDTKILVITINETPTAPEITSPLTDAGTVNQPYSYTITADGTNPITFDASSLPAGLTFSGNTISGIPTSAGTYNIPLSATNVAGTDNETLVLIINGTGSGTDTDGDGVPDNIDAYPTDPERAYNSYYPNEVDFGSFVYEDLWPYYGDYDFNDLVVNFNFKIVTNAQDKVVDLVAKLQIMAEGASMNNGFGLVFNTPSTNVGSVSGCVKVGNAVNIDAKGFETGHSDKTVIIPFDAVADIIGDYMVNTVPGGATVQTQVQTITVHFDNPPASIGTPPYNPFIFVDQERGKEVHLKDQEPTALVDNTLFGSGEDATNPDAGHYYRSSTGLPWAVEVPDNFDYPVESVDVLLAYLHFAAWAQSSGNDYPDWYEDKAGYRDDSKLYKNNN
jgi:LruC domain-containing protein